MINRGKLEHMLAYAYQQKSMGAMRCHIMSGDMVEILEQLLIPGESKSVSGGWVKCNDRMPECGVDVLACNVSPIGGYDEIETAQWHGGMKGNQPVFITSADIIEPELWMPLPAEPQQEVDRDN